MNKEQIESTIVERLDNATVKIKEDHTGISVQVNYKGTLNNYQLEGLLKIGIVEVKRSGAGLKISIIILNIK